MSVHPVMIALLVVLLGLLALSVGYRPERSAVGQIRGNLRVLRRLAQEHPARYGPAMAQHLCLLALELRESGRPAQALMAAMTAVDVLRTLDAQDHARYEDDLRDALVLEDSLKDEVGITVETDLFSLAAKEEADLVDAAPAGLSEGQDPDDGAPGKGPVYIWQIALAIWLLSVVALVSISLLGR